MLEKIKDLYMNNTKKLVLITILALLAIVLLSTGIVTQINKNIENKKAEEIEEFAYQIYKVNGKRGTALIVFYNENGINTVTYKNEDNTELTIYGNGKNKVAIDYEMEEFNTYEFKTSYMNGEEKTFTIDFEIPRIQGLYTLKNGVYVNEPDISTGFVKEKTRYLYLNDEQNLVPGNWIVGDAPENWYDYANQQWANIYVESEGLESYYVWIPRYCYKVDTENSVTGNERMDIKFINVYNEYIDSATGEKTSWDDLEKEGYQIPEAFSWDAQYGKVSNDMNIPHIIPGYWISKYQLAGLASYTIDYSAIVNLTSIEVTNIKLNTSKTIAQYIYAMDGIEYHREVAATSSGYTFENVPEGNKTVNVTILDENGEIIGSMTKTFEVAEPNAPDLTGFDPDTTFYVYWDEDGNEHNEVPISMDAPKEWYNYTIANWANIVSRNDGLETYYVWIPRYSYKLNNVSQRSYIKFLEGTTTTVDAEYQIPEAFWWDNDGDGERDEGEELTGYWITKYQLTSEESTPRMDAQMSAGSNLIRIKDITGTLIAEAETNGTNVKYEYYLNGEYKREGTSSTENYVYEGLTENTTYTITIIARNKDTNEYIGAVTKKITTIDAYAPDVSEFNKDETYYVTYDNEGNETRTPLTEDVPSDWYDYSDQKWANIVTTANGTETYFVWIPRYEYKILSDRTNLSTANRRVDVNFITTEITNSNCTAGYKVPEAFWWDNNSDGVQDEGEQLKGYWISKYQLSSN